MFQNTAYGLLRNVVRHVLQVACLAPLGTHRMSLTLVDCARMCTTDCLLFPKQCAGRLMACGHATRSLSHVEEPLKTNTP